jgi:S-adenosylmethionine decarboxylase proenzyme
MLVSSDVPLPQVCDTRVQEADAVEVGRFQGRHLMAEFYGVSAAILDDDCLLIRELVDALALSGATLCGVQAQRFSPAGVTVVALLAESHASIHTYPERRSMFLDIFTCGACQPGKSLGALVRALKPDDWNASEIVRGNEPLQTGEAP